MLAALSGHKVDRLPVAPIYLNLYLAEEIRRQALARYRALIGDRKEMPLMPAQEATIQAAAIRAASESLGEGADWVWARLLPPADWLAECVLQQKGDRLWRVHKRSGEREELSRLVVATTSHSDRWEWPVPRSQDEVDRLAPVPATEGLVADGSLAAVRRLVEEIGDEIFVCGTLGTPFWKCYSLLGFQGLMTMPYDNPGLLHYLLQRQTEAALALLRAFAAVGVAGVFIEECMTSADLVSPRIYDEFVFPYDVLLLDEIRALGLPTIFYICGDMMRRRTRLIELAPTALAVEESKKGFRIDLAEVAAGVGDRMALLGNLDATQIKAWDDLELSRQIAAQWAAARPARGFIVSMGSPFPLDTPRERVAAFFAAAREFT
jgi:uroporphyrinogen-III decarboxylase